MRILFTTDTVGGVFDYTATLADALAGRGHDILTVVIGPLEPGQEERLSRSGDVEQRDSRLAWVPGGEHDVAETAAWLREVALLWRADLAHINQMEYTGDGFPVPSLVVSHSDVLSWFSETRGEAAPAECSTYKQLVSSGLRGADTVVAPSAYQSALLRLHYGRAADRVIHNAAPPASASNATDALRNGVRSSPVVLTAGRAWDAAKGLATLDDALALLGDDAPETHLLGALIGPSGERFVPRHIHTHGRTSSTDVDRWMHRAQIYVGCSLYEPFGLAPLEAALHGCVLVLSDIGSFRELWDGCAEFFDPGDAKGLAAALQKVSFNADYRERLAATAMARAQARYTCDRMVGDYLALYRELVEDRLVTTPTQGSGACI